MSLTENKISTNQVIRFSILAYWSAFWLFNVIDKLIGGSMFLWVGRDRFAQFQKFFASAGLDSPLIADASLIIAAGLEVFACVFFTGALVHFLWKRTSDARAWFLVGIIFTLITFTIFSIGDHIFGDRFELLEHTLFWFITLFSWVIFNRLEVEGESNISLSKGQKLSAAIIAFILVCTTSLSIFNYNENHFHRRTSVLESVEVGTNLYKVSFPFLGGSKVFEGTLAKFKLEHPAKKIVQIYSVPKPLKLKKADSLIFYIVTDDSK